MDCEDFTDYSIFSTHGFLEIYENIHSQQPDKEVMNIFSFHLDQETKEIFDVTSATTIPPYNNIQLNMTTNNEIINLNLYSPNRYSSTKNSIDDDKKDVLVVPFPLNLPIRIRTEREELLTNQHAYCKDWQAVPVLYSFVYCAVCQYGILINQENNSGVTFYVSDFDRYLLHSLDVPTPDNKKICKPIRQVRLDTLSRWMTRGLRGKRNTTIHNQFELKVKQMFIDRVLNMIEDARHVKNEIERLKI